MVTFLIFLLLAADIVLFVFIAKLHKKQTRHQRIMKEITEERHMLTDLRQSVEEELKKASSQSRENLSKVTLIATEVEQEIKNVGELISKEIDKYFDDYFKNFEEPLKKLERQNKTTENLLRQLKTYREVLQKQLARAERFTKLSGQKFSYEELIDEVQEMKYKDAKALLARGITPKDVARDIGLPESEVRLLAGI